MSCVNWNVDKKANVSQDNNAAESFATALVNDVLTDIKSEKRYKLYRESCGPSMVESGLEGLGEPMPWAGFLQPSDAITMWLNDPARKWQEWHAKRYPNEGAINWKEPINRYGRAYVRFIEEVYPHLRARWINKNLVSELRVSLRAKQTIAFINLHEPGHYVTGLHIDEHDVITYNDSWLGNTWNPATTHKRVITLDKTRARISWFMLPPLRGFRLLGLALFLCFPCLFSPPQ